MIKVEFDQDKFNREINILCKKGVDFIDAVVVWCENNNVEIDLVASIIKKDAENKNKILEDARKKHLIKE